MINGCMNRPDQTEASGYWAQDGWTYEYPSVVEACQGKRMTRKPIIVWIPHTMTRECVYSRSVVGAACDGCASKREAV